MKGVSEDKVFFIGNVMIDSLVEHLPKAEKSNILENLGLISNGSVYPYILITMHRPSNVDNPEYLKSFFEMLNRLAQKRRIIFPMHPRTKARLENQIFNISKNIVITEPIGYLDFLKLQKYAEIVVTDSGGILEETTYLGVPCISIRNNTERPVTIEVGTNILSGTNLNVVEKNVEKLILDEKKKGGIPELWDGKTASRIINVLNNN